MSIRIAIAQCAPALGAVKRNLDMHEKWIARARAAGARLVVFPELSITGYYLKDLAADVACAADDPQLAPIAEASRDIDISAGFVERSVTRHFQPCGRPDEVDRRSPGRPRLT